jgi:nucleotide-binding universal stress UspA family protein
MAFRRIIVAFDGSEPSADALALALRLQDPGGVLTLACVVPGQRWHVAPHVHRPDAPVPEELATMFGEARATIPARIRVRQRAPVAASPARGLTELAESESTDLIVIGSSRHGDAGRIQLERTAGRLLQGAPCAVAIAPAGLRENAGFRHVGIAYDGSPEARAALAVGYDVAERSGSAVTLFSAVGGLEPEPMAVRRRADVALDEAADSAPADVNPRTVLLRGSPAAVIREACDGVVDLLVTGSRGYGPMQRALAGSVSEALTEGAPYPVVVVPRPAGTVRTQDEERQLVPAERRSPT